MQKKINEIKKRKNSLSNLGRMKRSKGILEESVRT